MDPFVPAASSDPFAGDPWDPPPPTAAMASFDPFSAPAPSRAAAAPAGAAFDPFAMPAVPTTPSPALAVAAPRSPQPQVFDDPFSAGGNPAPAARPAAAPPSQGSDPFSDSGGGFGDGGSSSSQSALPSSGGGGGGGGGFDPFSDSSSSFSAPQQSSDSFGSAPPAANPFGSTPQAADPFSSPVDPLDQLFGAVPAPALAPTPAPAAAPPVIQAQSLEELDIWGTSEADNSAGAGAGAGAADDTPDTDADLELQSAAMETYDVVFPHETKLGMLLERYDEHLDGGGTRERTLVKMCIEDGAAAVRGVTVGSKVVSLNGQNMLGKPYIETLELVKTMPRPLKVTLEKAGGFTDASQGICYTRKDMGTAPPSAIDAWQFNYFVIGGAVAKPNVLQLYESKADYEDVVVRMFNHRSIDHIPFKAYKLNLAFKCGPVTTKTYPGRKTVTYFWLQNPRSYTKVLKIGSDNGSVITGLRIQVSKHTSQA